MRLAKILLTCLAAVLPGKQSFAAGRASHVVLVVWDGMRPDFVTEATTPTLFAMASNGVTFLHHHPVYLSTTEVNATALATGVYPWQSGLIGNREFRPDLDPLKGVATEELAVVRLGDELSGNHYLAFPTVAEILHEHGLSTAVAGTKPVALLHDRASRTAGSLGVDIFAGNVLPEAMGKILTSWMEPFPKEGSDKINMDQWTTDALTAQLWRKGVPSFSVLWLAEPDFSQHHHGPGAPESLAAIKGSDRDLAQVLKTLRRKKVLDSTDVIVVSDHGFSTIWSNIDVEATLKQNGFHAARKLTERPRKDGDIMVVGNSGAVFCYVAGHEAALIARVVHSLQAQPYSGVIFSRAAVEGAFPMEESEIASPGGPDIVVTMSWTSDKSKNGTPSLIYCDGKTFGPGLGMHGTLSAFDMHNICFAFGPDFAKGMKDPLPSGNIDIAPTILWLLGIEPEKKMSGRVLSEALTVTGPGIQSSTSRHREAKWKGDGFVWRQYLDSSEVDGVTYLNQGNGGQFGP